MSKLSSEQLHVLSEIRTRARVKHASPKQVKAAVETGLVESNLTNEKGGDGDSQGWRQERASIYKDPRNLTASIDRFFDETAAVKGKYGSAGALAAAVQRPAAQYRGRYQERSGDADSLLGGLASSRASSASHGGSSNQAEVDAATEANRRKALVGNLISKHNPNSVLLSSGVLAQQAVPKLQTLSSVADSSTPAGSLGAVIERANKLDSRKLPYKWGGGHGGKADVSTTGPVDCSGAVSAVLGINPKVSGDFAKWGKAGHGKGITIYANSTHVIAEINGHFFGTSQSNPGGGAGWIPRSAISPAYLSKFTARHPAGE